MKFNSKKSQNSYINESQIHHYTSEHSLCVKCKILKHKSLQYINSSLVWEEQDFLCRMITSVNTAAINASAEYVYTDKLY